MNKKLFEKVDRILWEDWDPIGVNDYGGPNDEYRSYIPSIIKLLHENTDELRLSELLHQHANSNMGLSTELDDHRATALKLLKLLN